MPGRRPRAPTRPRRPFHVVGVGASAGGLAAFEAFLSAFPSDTPLGMAFVLVQHLAPAHKSLLSELVRRFVSMPVHEVESGMAVEPDHVYVIPPNTDMAIHEGALRLLEPALPHGRRLPIDFFFRSLAEDQGERAIAVVLSGSGSDGTIGARLVKEAGGVVLAQTPETTEYDDMPRHAIITGVVDAVLPPAEMAARIMAIAAGGLTRDAAALEPTHDGTQDALNKIFVLLRAHTGHDFSRYKPNTISRRLARRLNVLQIDRLDAYIRHLRESPAEADALFRDLLIGVTHFFRDPAAFETLERQGLERVLTGRPIDAPVRAWIPGCSTGEEAYSVAIILREALDARKLPHGIQVFATDIDRHAIDLARSARYAAGIAADVPAERLARHFERNNDGSYRVAPAIRDLVIFSEQDVIRDPPFSRLDLISCRNLLIYLESDIQQLLFGLFHYGLNPGGLLLLGNSETLGNAAPLFVPVDRDAKLYQRHDAAGKPAGARTVRMPMVSGGPAPRPSAAKTKSQTTVLADLTKNALLERHAPPAALVDERGDILYLHGRTGRFLEPAPGEAALNVLKMARDSVRRVLTPAFHKAVARKEFVRESDVRVKTNGDSVTITLGVSPLTADSADPPALYLVTFEPIPEAADRPGSAPAVASSAAEGGATPDPDENPRIAALTRELQAKEDYLETIIEELEASNEGLRGSNEEMQSVNEELQSANEEMETSKEELQSVNEELSTVNAELEDRLAELSRANNDLNNLLVGTGIGTIFVDLQLRIRRFTPSVTKIIHLIASDVGRPVGHVVSELSNYDRLTEDVEEMLSTLEVKEVEVRSRDGAWYLLRMRPYRTSDNVIDGGVVTFTDITEIKNAQAERRETEGLRRLAVVVRDASDAITVQGLDGRIQAWNPGAERLYGWREEEALRMSGRDLVPQDESAEALATLLRLSSQESSVGTAARRLHRSGRTFEIQLTATLLIGADGRPYAIATTERPVHTPAVKDVAR